MMKLQDHAKFANNATTAKAGSSRRSLVLALVILAQFMVILFYDRAGCFELGQKKMKNDSQQPDKQIERTEE
jgi:hypothetical protein